MALTAQQLTEAVGAFAATISQQSLGLAHHCPAPEAVHTDCLANAVAFVEQYGGEVRFGWYFQLRTLKEQFNYLVATNHVVWLNPEDHHLVDVTPYPPDGECPPLTHKGDLIFLVDDEARPFEQEEIVAPLPRRFQAVMDDEEIKQQVTKLQVQEYERFNRRYGTSFR